MSRRCCCCPPNELADCGAIGHRTLRDAPDPAFNEVLWRYASDATISRELLTHNCAATDGLQIGDETAITSLSIDVDDPAVDWYAIQILWPEDVTINQIGWLDAIADQASYAKPAARWQAKRDLPDSFPQFGPSSPMVAMGVVLRQAGQPDAYSRPRWIEDNTNQLAPVLTPRCWTSFSVDRPDLLALDPDEPNRLDLWPFVDSRSRFDSPTNAWVFGSPLPFSDWPPSTGDWELGLYVMVASRPETYLNSSGETVNRPAEFERRLDTTFTLRLALRSVCLFAAVVPACQAWFADKASLTLSVPDPSTPDGPGYGPIEPLQWRGLECSLTVQEIEVDEALYLDPRWRFALTYKQAFVGTITDAELTLGHAVQFVFVPCVGIAVTITPSNDDCEFGFLIQPPFDGPQTMANGGRLSPTYREPPPPDYQDAPDWYPVTTCDLTVYEPQTDPVSYNPISLAYRGRVINFPHVPFAVGNCATEACDPYATGWSCSLTLLRRLSFQAQYESTSIAGATAPCAFWIWLEIRSND